MAYSVLVCAVESQVEVDGSNILRGSNIHSSCRFVFLKDEFFALFL